jgi:hypothetical protein
MTQEEIDAIFKSLIQENWVNEHELREQAHYGFLTEETE